MTGLHFTTIQELILHRYIVFIGILKRQIFVTLVLFLSLVVISESFIFVNLFLAILVNFFEGTILVVLFFDFSNVQSKASRSALKKQAGKDYSRQLRSTSKNKGVIEDTYITPYKSYNQRYFLLFSLH